MTSRKHMSRTDVVHIAKVIESGITEDGEDGGTKYVRYNDGWSDDRVATVTGQNISNVRRLRQELFGQLRRTGNDNGFFRQVAMRVEALERRVAELEDATTRPRTAKSMQELGTLLNGPPKS